VEDAHEKAPEENSDWHINSELVQHGWTNGVRLGDGDGTVPLLSLGLLPYTYPSPLLMQPPSPTMII